MSDALLFNQFNLLVYAHDISIRNVLYFLGTFLHAQGLLLDGKPVILLYDFYAINRMKAIFCDDEKREIVASVSDAL